MEEKKSNRYVWCGSEKDICIPTTIDVDDETLESSSSSLHYYINVKKKDQGIFRFYDQDFQLECNNHCRNLHQTRGTVFNIRGLLSNILNFQTLNLVTPWSRTSKPWMSTIHETKKGKNNIMESKFNFNNMCPKILSIKEANDRGLRRISPLPFNKSILKRCQTDLSWIPHFLSFGLEINFWSNGIRVATLREELYDFSDMDEDETIVALDLKIYDLEFMTKIVGPISIYLTNPKQLADEHKETDIKIENARMEAIRVAGNLFKRISRTCIGNDCSYENSTYRRFIL